jgi:glyceraldehyde 3-phosphate dehydrogenase
MATKIGINGFGRIGRLFLRRMLEVKGGDLEIAAVNDLTEPKINAHLFKFDSTYGIFPGEVQVEEGSMMIDGRKVAVFAEADPGKIPWRNAGVEIVVESTGRFTDVGKASAHLEGGAKKVIISAPLAKTTEGAHVTVVMGINEESYDPARHQVISNASCTTNCIAPVVKVLHDRFEITRGLMTTIHSYTNDQRLLDFAHRDLRRARAAAVNMIPTTTGAAKAVSEVIPELKGRLHGLALRVPTPTVSVCDLVADLGKEVTESEINGAFREEARGRLKGILEVTDLPLVSSDFRGNPASSIVDAAETMVIQKSMVKVLAWYDNEWGYSCRLVDLAAYVAQKGL